MLIKCVATGVKTESSEVFKTSEDFSLLLQASALQCGDTRFSQKDQQASLRGAGKLDATHAQKGPGRRMKAP